MGELDLSLHAKALASLGASHGGKARAESLTPEERKQIARQAAEARWGNAFPRATHTGQLVIAGKALSCAVLENSTRVLTQATLINTIRSGASTKEGRRTDGLHLFLAAENLQPFISEEARRSATPVVFRSPDGSKTIGYEAKALPLVCQVYVQARDQGTILPEQQPIVQICDLLTRGLGQVDITVLVDQSTGYEERRAIHELTKILEAYLLPELSAWVRKFPDEFFQQIFRLQDWPPKPGAAKPTAFLDQLLRKYVFGQLPDDVLSQLRKPQPPSDKGYHRPSLTARPGNLHLDRQISIVTAIMKISDDKDAFEKNCAKAFAKQAPKPPLLISAQPPQQREAGNSAARRVQGRKSNRS